MKIITASKFYYQRGGLESYMFKFSNLFKKIGHDIIPFSTKHPETVNNKYYEYFADYIDLSGAQRASLTTKMKALLRIFYNVNAQQQFSKLINHTKPDLIFGFGVHRQLSPSIFFEAKKNSIPIIHRLSDYALICPDSRLQKSNSVNCDNLLCATKGYHNAILNKCVCQSSACNGSRNTSLSASIIGAAELYFHSQIKAYTDNVNKFISPSKFLMNKIIQAGIPAEKISYIPIFIDATKYSPEYNSQAYAVFFGRLSKEKGLDNLIEAMSNLKMHQLLIVGDGPEKNRLQNIINNKKLNNVKLLGAMHGDQLSRVVRNSRFVIVPSNWYDNSPNVILEAFALGKPVLGADIGGIPEYIEENITGLLYKHNSQQELEEKINYLMSQVSFCTEMGINARNLVENIYNPKQHYELVMSEVNKLI